MGFTREQLEKIISEAPEGFDYYHSVSGFYSREGWASDVGIPTCGYGCIFSICELAEKLQEIKVQESKQAEIDNTAQQVSSLAKESERDIEKADDGKWQNGDILYYPNGYSVLLIGFHDSYPVIYDCDPLSTTYKCDYSGELSKEKPLTPEQKQQQIDEKNGKKFYDIQHDIADVDTWDTVDIEDKHYWIEFAKKVSFKGKLESI